ncbi:MAG: hypothetical protein ABSE87_01065 [Terracidiphilus sp.]
MKNRISLPFRRFSLSHASPVFSACAALILFATLFPVLAVAQDSQWVRPVKSGDPLVWGRRDGIVFGLFSPGGIKGPRGLIRIGLFTPGNNEPQLLNFIAVEPVTQGPGQRFDRMAFSEMEMSVLDPGLRGKRMWVHPENGDNKDFSAGTLETLHVGDATLERLSVRIDVEKFTHNGAHVYVVASIDSNQPSQLRLSTFAESDSPPIEELALTATMGNYERLRLLWLKDRVVDSRELFANYPWPLHWRLETGDDFAEKENYPLPEMLRTGDGDAIVFCTSSEPDPGKTPGNDSAHWPYRLPKLTQYWLVPGYDVQPDLRVRVNARHTYWASTAPVLGGVAFENFEVRQRYVSGQTFIFGITPQEPWVFYHGSSHLSPFKTGKPQVTEMTH